VLRPGGTIVLWLGDAELAGLRVAADQQTARLAPTRAEPIASAAQEREDSEEAARREHLPSPPSLTRN
jgi:hypothetical protein